MNKTEFVNAVVEKINSNSDYIRKEDVSKVLAAFEDVIEAELVAGNDVQLTGFGTFYVAQTTERMGRNPKTGEALMLPARKAPKFKAGSNLKKALNS